MRLLHTSDWHIGRQLHGVSLLEDQAHVLDQIVEIAEREAVDAVIIAGDIYDRAVPPAEAVKLLSNTLNRLCRDLGKQLILIAGNHDSGDRLGFGSDLLGSAGLHIIGPLKSDVAKITLEKNGHEVDVFGLPYAGPLTVRQVLGAEVSSHEEAMSALLDKVHEASSKDRSTVVVAHCFVDGAAECESERPLSIGGADRVSASLFQPFSYAALGHLHGRQYQGSEHVRYSGSILKYSFSEANHHKSITLVDIEPSGQVDTCYVELEAIRDLRIVEGSLEDILARGKTDTRPDDFILARISDTESIIDVMGKLREVYPNVLQMQNTGIREHGKLPGASREMLKKSHMNLFEGFFKDVQEEELSEEQRAYMVKLLENLQEEGSL
ncbi:MAG: exonuclease SbcCD subunit D [Halioglobus sp.]